MRLKRPKPLGEQVLGDARLLFEHQDPLAPRDLIAGTALLGLDIDPFTDDLRQPTYAERLREDFLSGVRSGVNGTPTFFINGVRHEGSFDFETMLEAIQARLRNLAA